MAVPPSSDASYLLPIFCLSSPHLLPIFSHFTPTTRRLQAIHQSSGLSLMAAPSSLQSFFQHFQSAALVTSYKLPEDFCVSSIDILRPSTHTSSTKLQSLCSPLLIFKQPFNPNLNKITTIAVITP
eukprot:Filipodium_phascolosomae@DN2802_c0_g1_i4.p1